MLTVSLHGIKLHAKVGLYPEEKIKGNDFEVDVDVVMNTDATNDFPFIDYTVIEQLVSVSFQQPGELLETFVRLIFNSIKHRFPEANKVRVAVRKLNPPMKAQVQYSQVCFEA